MSFAQRLSELMASRTLTNYQLAKDLDIHPTTVANWLAGKAPRKKTLALLAEYFGVSTDYLLGIDTRETVDISLLKNEEKEVIYALIEYFHKSVNAFKMLERLGYVPFDDEALESL